jgi:hypothetical protein
VDDAIRGGFGVGGGGSFVLLRGPVLYSGADAASDPHGETASDATADPGTASLGQGKPLGRPRSASDLVQGGLRVHLGASVARRSATVAAIPRSHRPDGGYQERRNATGREDVTPLRPRGADVRMQSAFVGTGGDA